MIGQLAESHEEPVYSIVRALIGGLFMQHGLQKVFGLFGGVDGSGGTASLNSLYGIAGIVELFGGLLIVIGVGTRLIAVITAGEMITAQVLEHLPNGLIPIQNGGELGLLYTASFLLLIVYGSGQYSVDRLIRDREQST